MSSVKSALLRSGGLSASIALVMTGSTGQLDAAASIELHGNFNTIGVIVTIDSTDDPDNDAVATLSFRTGAAAFAEAFPLTRTRETQFVGSLFDLSPGTSYDLRVDFTDPDGGVLDGVSASASLATRAEIAVPTPNTSYRVSPTGSGTTCSVASPCALTYGIQQAQPGDEVVLAGGVYRQGEISLPRSGSSGSPIVIRAGDGESPILDGSDPQDFVWLHEGDGVYSTTVNVTGAHLVAAEGERLYPYQSAADLQSLSWGIPGFFADGTTLKVHLTGNTDPNPLEMRVSRYNSGFIVDYVDHIFIIGLTFRYFGRGQWAKAVPGLESAMPNEQLLTGSRAQRDVLAMTLIEIRLRAGERRGALEVLRERAAAKPQSVRIQRDLARCG